MSLKTAQAYAADLPAGQRRRSVVSRWFTGLDNFDPIREYTNGHAVSFIRPDNQQTGYVLFGIGKLANPSRAVYVVDDGTTVTAMYPVAWHDGTSDEYGERVVLHSYPVGESSAVWSLGPRRSYHIKLSPVK